MSFRSVFIAIVGFALIVAAFMAPPFAPLLFPNLVLLSLIALSVLRTHLPHSKQTFET